MINIQPDQVYTTREARSFLRISERTMKRWLKHGIIRANKVGGRYRIMGAELLRLVSPKVERSVEKAYGKLKRKVRETISSW